jgi:hypothetical protein
MVIIFKKFSINLNINIINNLIFKKGYCRFCCSHSDDVQNFFSESQCIPRTQGSHLSNLNEVTLSSTQNSQKSVHVNGVIQSSCLSDLKFLEITDALPFDLMHDLLEGNLVTNLSLLMDNLEKNKILKTTKFCADLRTFKYGRHDKDNAVPFDLFTKKRTESIRGFKISATHMWTLIRIFPIMYGNLLKGNRNYLHFVQLIEIFRSLNGEIYSNDDLNELTIKIEDYLKTFKTLYPAQPLTAKHHFLIHYPRCIERFGPPLWYSTMR